MSEMTPRFCLPLLEAGQAQKEMFHYEAVLLLEALVQPVVQTAGNDAAPAAPVAGQAWIVGTAPTGDWAGHPGAIAAWTDGGWRFAAPADGMGAWVVSAGLWARHAGGVWTVGAVAAASVLIGGTQVVGAQQPAIPAPPDGGTTDAGARAAIAAILDALRRHGLVAT